MESWLQDIKNEAFVDELQKIASKYVEISPKEIASKADILAGKYKPRESFFGRRIRARQRAKKLMQLKILKKKE